MKIVTNNDWSEGLVEAWVQSYARHNYGDPHAHFAMLLRMERNEAKRICYEFMHSRRFLKGCLTNKGEENS